MSLGKIYTIPELAEKIGWTRERLWRYLTAANEANHMMILHNAGRGKIRPRWTVSAAAVKAIAPHWFVDPEELQRWRDSVDDDIKELKIVQELHTVRFAELAKAG